MTENDGYVAFENESDVPVNKPTTNSNRIQKFMSNSFSLFWSNKSTEECQYQPLTTDEIDESEKASKLEPFLEVQQDSRFQPVHKYRDIIFYIAFVIHILVAIFVGVKEAIQVKDCNCLNKNAFRHLFFLLLLSITATLTASTLLLIFHQFIRTFVAVVMVASCFFPLIVSSVAIVTGYWTHGILALSASFLSYFFLSLMQNRIEFATTILHVSLTCIKQNPSLVGLALVAVLPQLLWTVFVATALYGTIITFDYEARLISWMEILFLLLSLFWTFQVIRNIVHVTTSTRVATWYFYSDSNQPPKPTLSALKRACTISFGSICFGSLLIAMMQVIRFLLTQAKKQKKYETVARIAVSMALALETALIYFNQYALVYVAVYGTTFIQSAKNVGKIIKTKGVSTILNDDITHIVLTFVCVLNALVLSLLSLLFYILTSRQISTPMLMTVLWVGYCVAGVITSVISSAISTIYICFVEDPSALRSTHVEAYNSLASAWMIMYGSNQVKLNSNSASTSTPTTTNKATTTSTTTTQKPQS